MPYCNEAFKGRKKELTEIKTLLKNHQKVSLIGIKGIGGIGKSTLAKAFFLENHTEFDFFLFLEGKSDLFSTFNDTTLLANLDLEDSLNKISFETPNRSQIIFERVQNALANLEGTKLLLIDNAPIDTHLLKSLASSQWKIITTSRQKIDFIHTYEILQASPEDAIAIFEVYYEHAENNKTEIEKIVNRLAFHPLMIELVAKNAKRKEWTLAEINHKLAEKGLDIDQKTNLATTHSEAKIKDIFAYLLQIFPLEDLPEDELILLNRYSVLPALSIDKQTWAKMADIPEDDAQELCRELNEKGLISQNGKAFEMHALLAEIVRHKNQERLLEDCEEMIINIDKLLENTYRNNSRVAYFEYTPIAKSIVDHLNTNIPDRILELYSFICRSIGWVFKNYRGKEQSIFYANKALSFAKATKNDHVIAGIMGALTDIYRVLGQKDEALHCGQSSYNYYKNSTQQQNLHNVANNLALVIADFENKDMPRMAFAEKILLDGIKYAEENEDLDGLAQRTANLGYWYNKVERTSDSIIQHEKAVNIYENNPNSKLDSTTLYVWYHSLTRLHYNRNNYEKGLIFGYKAKKEGEKLAFDTQHELFSQLLSMIKEMKE